MRVDVPSEILRLTGRAGLVLAAGLGILLAPGSAFAQATAGCG